MPEYCVICKKPLPEGHGSDACSVACGIKLHKKHQAEARKEPKKQEPDQPPERDKVKAQKEFFERQAHPVRPVQSCKGPVAAPSKKKAPPKEEPRKKEEEKPSEQLKIWLLTWNCANTTPKQTQLNSLIVSDLKSSADKPDVIVIGVQEYPRKDTIPKKIVQSLADSYQFIDENVVDGWSGGTKWKLGLDGRNCQAVGVLANKDVQAQKLAKANGNRKHGKGGVILGVKITKKESAFNLAFISAHLDSYDKREADIQLITNAVPKIAFDAVFMMGDLNYRLDPKGVTFTRTSICDMISSNPSELLKKHDELLSSSLVQEGAYQFEFPDPAVSFPPTYKIKSYTAGDYLLTYFGKNGVKKPNKKLKPKKKRTGVDIGWLDRIGWAKKWDKVLSGKGEVTQEDYMGLHDVVMSDHAAVLMKVTVSVKK